MSGSKWLIRRTLTIEQRLNYWELSSAEKEKERRVSRTPRSGFGVVLEAKQFFGKQSRK
jgi:hypothetical protein